MLRNHTVLSTAPPIPAPFHEGDEVRLAHGTYQGTLGVFRHLNQDPKWAEIQESDHQVRSHPVEWMELVRH